MIQDLPVTSPDLAQVAGKHAVLWPAMVRLWPRTADHGTRRSPRLSALRSAASDGRRAQSAFGDNPAQTPLWSNISSMTLVPLCRSPKRSWTPSSSYWAPICAHFLARGISFTLCGTTMPIADSVGA